MNFQYLNSLLEKDAHDRIFRKNTSYIPVDNGSSFKTLIIKLTRRFINITLIETSVVFVQAILYYLIFNFPLLCTSSWRFEICLPVMYDPIEYSPDIQITPKLFVSINSTNIYISSYKRMLYRAISVEVRFNTFPFSC